MPLSPVTRLPKALVPEGRIISAPTKFGRTVTRSPKALVPEGRYCVTGDVNPRKQVGIKLTQPRRGGTECPGMCSRINIVPPGLEGVAAPRVRLRYKIAASHLYAGISVGFDDSRWLRV